MTVTLQSQQKFSLFSFSFTKTVTPEETMIWAEMLELVPNPNYVAGDVETEEEVCRVFVEISGPKTPVKQRLTNKMLVDWQFHLEMKNKKKKKMEDGSIKICPFYQPATQNVELRIFLGRLKKYHSFDMVESDFAGYTGSLTSVMEQVYQERYKKYVSKKE